MRVTIAYEIFRAARVVAALAYVDSVTSGGVYQLHRRALHDHRGRQRSFWNACTPPSTGLLIKPGMRGSVRAWAVRGHLFADLPARSRQSCTKQRVMEVAQLVYQPASRSAIGGTYTWTIFLASSRSAPDRQQRQLPPRQAPSICHWIPKTTEVQFLPWETGSVMGDRRGISTNRRPGHSGTSRCSPGCWAIRDRRVSRHHLTVHQGTSVFTTRQVVEAGRCARENRKQAAARLRARSSPPVLHAADARQPRRKVERLAQAAVFHPRRALIRSRLRAVIAPVAGGFLIWPVCRIFRRKDG